MIVGARNEQVVKIVHVRKVFQKKVPRISIVYIIIIIGSIIVVNRLSFDYISPTASFSVIIYYFVTDQFQSYI